MKEQPKNDMRVKKEREKRMTVGDLMTTDVKTCGSNDGLDVPARLMWANDCGSVPVVDENGHVLGMLTDRDICMAALTQGGPLTELRVSNAMASVVYSCVPEDLLATAEDLMGLHRIRRLPVITTDGRLVGILSLSDLAREASRQRSRKKKADVTVDGVSKTLAAVCERHDLISIATAV